MHKKKLARKKRINSSRMKMRELQIHRLTVTRSAQHVYAQIIAPQGDKILAAASTLEKSLRGKVKGNITGAKKVGELIAKKAKEIGVESVAFDRSGFKYHGCIKALAEASREAGLKF